MQNTSTNSVCKNALTMFKQLNNSNN